MPVSIQVLLSLLLVAIVLYFMWRIPRPKPPAEDESFFNWAPPLALLSSWIGLLALAGSMALWFVPWPDLLVTWLFLAIAPASICAGTLTLWIYRRYVTAEQTILLQCLQARVGISLGLLAVMLGYVFVFTHKDIGTAVGM